jgi:hypothetical protein
MKHSAAYSVTGALLVAFSLVLFDSIFTFESFFGGSEETYIAFIIAFTVIVFTAALVFTRRQLKRSRQAQLEYYTVGILRFVTSSVMLGYSFTKLHNGHMYLSYAALDTRLNELNDFDTVWGFYGRYSSFQALLGIMELIPAILLLFRRTALTGAIILLPVVANVALLNWYYRIGGLTLPVSVLLLLFDMYIIYSYWDLIAGLFREAAGRARPVTIKPGWRNVVIGLKFAPLTLILCVLMIRVIRRPPPYPVTGGYELVEMKRNGAILPEEALGEYAIRKIYFEKRKVQSSVKNGEGLQGASITFLPHDSLKISYRRGALDVYVKEDTIGMFKGTYQIAEDKLILHGLQNSSTVDAIYLKMNLREFSYWWK